MKIVKKISICIVIILLYIAIFQTVNAFGPENLTGTPVNNAEANSFGNKIITIISTIGSITSVIVLVIIGIKYMLGSVEEKAVYKKTLMPYAIGAGLVFSASTIAGIIYAMLT